jgi:uncharacterized protein (TIGR03437 family)
MWRSIALFCLGLSCFVATGQIACQISAVPAIVRAEGYSEQFGDVVFNCQGASPDQLVTLNFTVFVATNITNRILPDNSLDIVVTTERGLGQPPEVSPSRPRLFNSNSFSVSGVPIRFNSEGRVGIKFNNIRGNARLFYSATPPPVPEGIRANISINGTGVLPVNDPNVIIAFPRVGLRGLINPGIIDCSRRAIAPARGLFADFVTGAVPFFTTRVTEGFGEAFQIRNIARGYNGVRVMIRYSGVPQGLKIFVPDVVAGSLATAATSAGDLGLVASGGRHTPTAEGSLLLARVAQPRENGSGLGPVFRPATAGSTVVFNDLFEVPIENGNGLVVYEVVDANTNLAESAQIPTFAYPTLDVQVNSANVSANISFAIVDKTDTASATADIPRFDALAPLNDCAIVGDCDASFLPRLSVDAERIDFVGAGGSGFQSAVIRVTNSGGGRLLYTVKKIFNSPPTEWLQIAPEGNAQGPRSVIVQVFPGSLPTGVYMATVEIDAGPFGVRRVPVRLEVTSPLPRIRALANATLAPQSVLAPGAIATLFGENLSGGNLQVTFDDFPATVFYSDAGQINLLVPPQLAGRTRTQVVVSAAGQSSFAYVAELRPLAPGIFPRAVLKADYTFPNQNNRALVGSTLQVFATGLLDAANRGNVVAVIHDRRVTPTFAGNAPNLSGVQQVNFVIPADLPTMATEVRLCTSTSGQQADEVCSWPTEIFIQRP